MGKFIATSGIMADGRGGPDVVHGPDDRLARVENLGDVVEREHSLVDPVQVYHVGLAELGQSGDVGACVGDVDVEEVASAEVQMQEDAPTLP